MFVLLNSTSLLSQLSGKTKKSIRSNDLEFFMPKGYVETTLNSNEALLYDFAISKGAEDFEIRYKIHSLKKELKAHKKNLKNPVERMVHPNFIWKMTLITQIKTLSGNDEAQLQMREFEEEAFSSEFIGDAGGICFLDVSNEINSDYKYAIVMAIHRNFKADVYVTFFGNDKENLQDNSIEAFHAIRFSE